MNTTVLRVVFQTEPSAEVQMIVERKLKNIAKLLAPDVEPEVYTGLGSFWISVSVVAVPVLGWLAIQTASWAWNKYVLDKHLGPKLEGQRSCGEIPEGTPTHRDEQVLQGAIQRIPSNTDLAHSPIRGKLQQAIPDLMKSLEESGSVQMRFANFGSDPESTTGMKGIICIWKIGKGRQSMDLIEVDSREDFHSVLRDTHV